MRKQSTRILVAFMLILFWSGSVTVHVGFTSPEVMADEGPPVVQQLVKSTRSWNGETLPSYPQGQPEITILRISIPPGTRLETHSHPVINAGVLLTGQLTVVTEDGKTLHLKAGDPIVEVVDKLHFGINDGNMAAEIIVFYAGVAGEPTSMVKPR